MSRKEIATAFLRGAARGPVRDAYDRYVASDFRHHTPYFAGTAEALCTAMEQNVAQFPDKQFDVQRTIEEGDLVAVHSHIRMKPGDAGIAVVHIFRFDGDRIAELWDVGQPVPEESPNENGAF